MHYLVTGGAGFIGSHLVERLLGLKHQVTVLDNFNDFYDPRRKRHNLVHLLLNPRLDMVEGDIRDRVMVERLLGNIHFDQIIHLAAAAGVQPSLKDPQLYLDVNVQGTFNLLTAAHYNGVKNFVFASSSSVYGINRKHPFAEDDPLNQTISPYAATKLAGEQLCSNFALSYGMQIVALRFFTVHGPRQRPDLAIHKFTKLMSEGRAIPKHGSGDTFRDYTYIDDIIDGVLAAMEYRGLPFEIFNLGGNHTVTLNELIGMLEVALRKTAVIDQRPIPAGDVPFTVSDGRKGKELLGYEPKTSIEQGIEKFVHWFQGSVLT